MPSLPSSRHRSPLLLEIDLTHPLVDYEPDDPIGKLRSRGKPRLQQLLRALHDAAEDARVVGLVAKIGDTQMPLAQAQEIRAAVAAFAASGKPTVAWAETFGEARNGSVPYFLASGFGEVWLQPSGELNLIGLATEVTFLRGALDKVGVEPQLDKRYEYKNAADRLQQTTFTEAHREAAGRLVESSWEQIVEAVAASRRRSVDDVTAASDRAPLSPQEALDAGFVDHIGYRDEVYSAVRRSVGGQVQLLFADRWPGTKPPLKRIVEKVRQRSTPGLALVVGHGAIVVGRSRRSPLQGALMGSDTVAAAIRSAVRDEKVRGIVFRVDSPGGSYVASDTVWREVGCARAAGKPVVVSMGNVAGSGGYFVACDADVIVAQPGTLTGSIGVFGGKNVTTELTGKLGLNYEAVQRGTKARMFSTHQRFSDEEQARLSAWLDAVYDDFTAKVAAGRGMSRDAVHEVARGRVWTGADAQRNGLVDELGGLRDAVAIARQKAGLPDDAPLRPAVVVPPLARLKPPRSSDDPRAAASVGSATALGTAAALFDVGWGSYAGLAAALGLPAAGPLMMPALTVS